MKENVVGIIAVIVLIVAGLAFTHTVGMGGSCCSIHHDHHQ